MSERDHPDVVAPPVAIHVGFILLGTGSEYLWPSGVGQDGITWYATGATIDCSFPTDHFRSSRPTFRN